MATNLPVAGPRPAVRSGRLRDEEAAPCPPALKTGLPTATSSPFRVKFRPIASKVNQKRVKIWTPPAYLPFNKERQWLGRSVIRGQAWQDVVIAVLDAATRGRDPHEPWWLM